MMIGILLATYNGENWLPAWWRSLLEQSETGWRLIVRDDDSTDGTPAVLAEMERDERCTWIRDGRRRFGAAGNFAALLSQARDTSFDYYAPADQDDVWLPHKLERQLAVMRSCEARFGRQSPLLVHTDLHVVDRELRSVHPSHTAYHDIRRDAPPPELLRTLLAHNVVTGCAALINRPLLELAAPVPSGVAMHDWWLALCATVAGHVEYFPEATVLYRQHEANVVGAGGGLRRFWQPAEVRKTRLNLRRSLVQIEQLQLRLRERSVTASADEQRLMQDYLALSDARRPLHSRTRLAWSLRAGRPGLVRRLLLTSQLATLGFAGRPRDATA